MRWRAGHDLLFPGHSFIPSGQRSRLQVSRPGRVALPRSCTERPVAVRQYLYLSTWLQVALSTAPLSTPSCSTSTSTRQLSAKPTYYQVDMSSCSHVLDSSSSGLHRRFEGSAAGTQEDRPPFTPPGRRQCRGCANAEALTSGWTTRTSGNGSAQSVAPIWAREGTPAESRNRCSV
jgi:hypothetical protein